MLTDTLRGPTDARKFAVRAVAVSLGCVAVLRFNWTETHLVLPFTGAQAAVAVGLFGIPALPVAVTLACSGADALALSFGAVLAYPVTWRARAAGAAGALFLILLLNTLRIGTLGRVAASPTWFHALHVYIWPAVLTLAVAGYVFTWMRLADRQRATRFTARPHLWRRFVVLTGALLLVFIAASPLYLESARVLAVAGFIARAAASILRMAGISAYASANVLFAPRGGFLVTQECISTPLIPIYLAAVCTFSTTWRRLVLGVCATLPLFVALGIARLLVVALPDAVASPIFFVHAFYQLLLGAVLVVAAALWRHGRGAAVRCAAAGILAGVLFVYLLGPIYAHAISAPAGAPRDDPQGAIAFLPAFQVGLYLALWVAAFLAAGWRRFVAGLAALALTQAAGLLALQALAIHSGLTAHVRDIRGWAIAGPLLILAAVVNVGRTRR